ncbi:MAG: flavodoxin [Thermoplasmata archaeon]|nr:flavodoxin [Thermoplasmata archaeon]
METKQTMIIVIAAVAVVACVAAAVIMMNGNNSDDPVDPVFPDLNENVILVYFSATEVTDGVAKKIQDYLGCDIYRIEPVIPYTKEDLNRDDPNSRVSKENADPNFRPAIAGNKIDLSRYSTVILGFPIWYHKEPKIIDSFLDIYDLSGLNIAPFCTSWSAGIAGALNRITTAEPNAHMEKSASFPSGFSEQEIYTWLDSVGFVPKN